MLSFISLFLFLITNAIGDEVKISSVNDFIWFKDKVKSGKNYSGTTVFLGSDIDLTRKTLEPIGNRSSNYLLGEFNRQGYMIKTL